MLEDWGEKPKKLRNLAGKLFEINSCVITYKENNETLTYFELLKNHMRPECSLLSVLRRPMVKMFD